MTAQELPQFIANARMSARELYSAYEMQENLSDEAKEVLAEVLTTSPEVLPQIVALYQKKQDALALEDKELWRQIVEEETALFETFSV